MQYQVTVVLGREDFEALIRGRMITKPGGKYTEITIQLRDDLDYSAMIDAIVVASNEMKRTKLG